MTTKKLAYLNDDDKVSAGQLPVGDLRLMVFKQLTAFDATGNPVIPFMAADAWVNPDGFVVNETTHKIAVPADGLYAIMISGKAGADSVASTDLVTNLTTSQDYNFAPACSAAAGQTNSSSVVQRLASGDEIDLHVTGDVDLDVIVTLDVIRLGPLPDAP